MNEYEKTVLMIKGLIASLPAAEQEACNELADHMRRQIAAAGDPVGLLALTLLGAEAQAKA